MAGLHNELFGDCNTAAAMFAVVEIQAGIAKENYDKIALAATEEAKTRVAGARLEVVTEEDIIAAGVDVERFERYRKPYNDLEYFWIFDLRKAEALDELKMLVELAALPPPKKKELTEEEQAKVDLLERTLMAPEVYARKQIERQNKKNEPKVPKDPEIPMLKIMRMDYTNTEEVCLALKTNTTFPKVDFSLNRFDEDTAKSIADLLDMNDTITAMDLSGSDLGNEGVWHIVEALKANTALKTLDVGLVSMGLHGARAVKELLTYNQTLTSLSISGNERFGVRGVEELCKGLEENYCLETLAMANVTCGNPGAERILEMLNTNHSLTEIHLEANRILEDVVDEIKRRLLRNYEQDFVREMTAAAKSKLIVDASKRVANILIPKEEAARMAIAHAEAAEWTVQWASRPSFTPSPTPNPNPKQHTQSSQGPGLGLGKANPTQGAARATRGVPDPRGRGMKRQPKK